MDEKIIVILLIVAIIISTFSMIITLNLNTNDLQIGKDSSFVEKPDTESANVGLTIKTNNQNT